MGVELLFGTPVWQVGGTSGGWVGVGDRDNSWSVATLPCEVADSGPIITRSAGEQLSWQG